MVYCLSPWELGSCLPLISVLKQCLVQIRYWVYICCVTELVLEPLSISGERAIPTPPRDSLPAPASVSFSQTDSKHSLDLGWQTRRYSLWSWFQGLTYSACPSLSHGFPLSPTICAPGLTLQSDAVRRAAPRGVLAAFPESSPLGLKDGAIRIPKSLSAFTPGYEKIREAFSALKVTGKKWFSSLYFAPSTVIVQKTRIAKLLSTLDPGRPGSNPASAIF